MPKTNPFRKAFLEFRYEKVVMIDLGDLKHHAIPVDIRYQPAPGPKPGLITANSADAGQMILLPYFDLSKVHRVEFQDELPHVPKKLAGMSAAHHEKLCDQAYERAARAKNANDEIRRRVYSYVANGTIEVVSDPFEHQEEVEGLAELAAAFKEADEAANSEQAKSERQPR